MKRNTGAEHLHTLSKPKCLCRPAKRDQEWKIVHWRRAAGRHLIRVRPCQLARLIPRRTAA